MALAAGAAGFMDAIAGGGGLITLPALLSTGLSPVVALATNKLQSTCSVATSCARFARTGMIDFRGYAGTALVVFLAASLGGLCVQIVPAGVLGQIMPFLILCVVAYMLLSPRMADLETHRRLSPLGYAPVAGLVGFYDGFFGPGAGSFYTTSLVALRGKGLTRAVANSKLFNFMSNFAALLMFAAGGHILWRLGLIMALAAMVGAWAGSHFAIRFGARVIRPVLILVSLALTVKLLWQNFA